MAADRRPFDSDADGMIYISAVGGAAARKPTLNEVHKDHHGRRRGLRRLARRGEGSTRALKTAQLLLGARICTVIAVT